MPKGQKVSNDMCERVGYVAQSQTRRVCSFLPVVVRVARVYLVNAPIGVAEIPINVVKSCRVSAVPLEVERVNLRGKAVRGPQIKA